LSEHSDVIRETQKMCMATYLSIWLLSEQCLATSGKKNLATLTGRVVHCRAEMSMDRTGLDWIRTEANFGRIRTGSDWENFSCFNV